MSWLSALGAIGSAIAAPFTGGTSLAFLPGLIGGGTAAADALAHRGGSANGGTSALGSIGSALGSIGSVLGGQQAGTNNARIAQGQLNTANDRNAIEAYIAQQNAQDRAAQLDLQRQQFASSNRGTTAKQAMIGALLGGGMTPMSVTPNGVSGGLLRSLNANPEALAALKTMGSQASTAQNTPLSFTGGQILAAPKLTPVPQINAGDGVMGTIAKIAQLGGAASPYLTGLIAKKNPADVGDYSTPPHDDPTDGEGN
jgi:hypothetical protein